MSQMTDRSASSHDGDVVSLKSIGKTATSSVRKETVRRMKTFRKSFQRVGAKSPLSSEVKGSKVPSKADALGNESCPPSPGLSSGSPVTSPLRGIGGLFQSKAPDDETSQDGKSLKRSKTDPNMAASVLKRGASICRSLTFTTKKDKEKTSRREAFLPISKGSMELREELKEEKVAWEEIEETYTLPEIPHTPLSVLEISKLIEMEVLEEAHLNLLSLRQEFQQEGEQCDKDSPVELAKKEKDLRLLYGDLRNKLTSIVRTSNSLPSRNKELLVHVARIIQEEEKRAQEAGGLPGSWMEAWREAVSAGVRDKVASVHLENCDKNTSWLSVHLGLLGKAIVEDLENVKSNLRWSYPPSFKVFNTYVRSYHGAVREHLKKLEHQATEQKDLFALLEWIIHRYKSESIMGKPSLQMNMEDESADLQLEDGFLLQLKEKFCCRVKGELSLTLGRVIQCENEEQWMCKKKAKMEDDFLDSDIHMDIWTNVKGTVTNARRIDGELEKKVIFSCLEELKQFPKRFETEFRGHHSALSSEGLWTEYQVTYTNSFDALRQHMDEYQDHCPNQVEGFRKEVKWLIIRLMQGLEDQFKEDIKPYLRRMMTRKWLTVDDDFQQIYSLIERLSQHCALMRPPHAQDLASRLHHHVVREYVGQLMKNNFSCRHRHEKAARKICHQWRELTELFQEMESSHEWLNFVGDDLSEIIGEKNNAEITKHLQPLVQHHPDFSKKHLVAVLNFRGLPTRREHRLILQQFAELKRTICGGDSDKNNVLFGDMEVTANTDCLSNLPFSCLNVLLCDN